MCAVLIAVGKQKPNFIGLGCIIIVVAANAGGAFSPFGDISTLMVWQKGVLEFSDFLKLFLPPVVNFLIAAFIMSFAVPKGAPRVYSDYTKGGLKNGGITITFMDTDLGGIPANILVGLLSAIVDNIPVMLALLTMNPTMDSCQWLLMSLTAGVGGSLLSVGSAAGVALMGQARGYYTFFGHLKWTPVIALGYFASIGVHLMIN